MSLAYGLDIKSHEHHFLSSAERALALMEEVTVPGAFLVNTFPSCRCQRKKLRVLLLNLIHSEASPIVVPWNQV